MRVSGEFLKKNYFTIIVFLYLLVQVIYLFFIDIPFTSDCLYYWETAQQCIEKKTFYPAPHNIHDEFITAPLYINYLIAILHIHNSPLTVRISNVFLNLLQLFLLYTIAGRLFGDVRLKRVTAIIYMMDLTNIGAVFFNFTEFIYGVFLLSSLYFYLKRTSRSFMLSGMFLMFSVNIRPIGAGLLLAYCAILTSDFIRYKRFTAKILYLFAGFVILFVGLGLLAKATSGYFVPASTTGSHNILLGANDEATGAYNCRVLGKDKAGYIANGDSLTFVQKNRIWKAYAYDWIGKHPLRWLSLMPAKLFHLFGRDDWAIPPLLNDDTWYVNTIAKMVLKEKRPQDVFKGESTGFIVAYSIIFTYHHIFYFLFVFLVLFQFVYYKKKGKTYLFTAFREIYLYVLFGVSITLLAVGAPRYNYSYIIILIPTIAPMVCDFFDEKVLKKR